MLLIDEPRYVPLEKYHRAIARMTEKVMGWPGVQAVYQIGGMSAPGISDLDVVVVFEDGVECRENPIIGLGNTDAYLFCHCLFGAPYSLFVESFKYTFFHNFQLLAGEDLRPTGNEDDRSDNLLKRQWAREFLVRMLVNLAVERSFGIYKIRNLLLHGKALLYDLDFLGSEAPILRSLLDKISEWRMCWFVRRPTKREIVTFLSDFESAFLHYITDHLIENPVFFPKKEYYRIGRNIELLPASTVAITVQGFRIPWLPSNLSEAYARKVIALLHRLNRIKVSLPFESQRVPPIISAAFNYSMRARAYNRFLLPHFMPLTSSLSLV